MKKLISIVSAIAMMATMAFTVNADGTPSVTLNYNADSSTETVAYIDVVVDGLTTTGGICIPFSLYEDGTNVTSTVVTGAAVANNKLGTGHNTSMTYSSGDELIMVTVEPSEPVSVPATGAAFQIKLTLVKDSFNKELTYVYDEGQAMLIADLDAGEIYMSEVFNAGTPIPGANVGPTTVTTGATKVDNAVAEEGETYIEKSDAAVAYWAEGAFTQGKSSAYWTANFGTAAKKYELGSLPNLDGNVKLGIVITGATDVSAVKLNVETTN